MIDYIKEHWVAYLIGVVVAILVGFGASYILGVKWSTPPEIRAQRIEKEKENGKIKDELSFEGDDSSAAESDDAASGEGGESDSQE